MIQYESQMPPIVVPVINPENLTNYLKTKTEQQIKRQVDSINPYYGFAQAGIDGRFSNSAPSEVLNMSNTHGNRYFVVGSSEIGKPFVAAP